MTPRVLKSTLRAICLLVLCNSLTLRAGIAGTPEEFPTQARAAGTTSGDRAPLEIPDGTPLEIELLSPSSSQVAKQGDVVDFGVVRPLLINGVTVIEKGALAMGRITKVTKAVPWGGVGRILLKLQYVVATDGRFIPIYVILKEKGENAGLLLALGAKPFPIFFPPYALLWPIPASLHPRHRKGDPVVVRPGTRFRVFLRGKQSEVEHEKLQLFHRFGAQRSPGIFETLSQQPHFHRTRD